MNNATEACRMYVERIKELEALLAAGTLEHDNRICDMHDINTRMQARIDDLEARNAELEREVAMARERLGPAGWKVLERLRAAEAAEARCSALEADNARYKRALECIYRFTADNYAREALYPTESGALASHAAKAKAETGGEGEGET